MSVPNSTQHRQHPILLSIGQSIRTARLEKKMSQEQLALLSEVDRSYIGRVERGDNNVAILTLAKISSALDLSLSDLMSKARL